MTHPRQKKRWHTSEGKHSAPTIVAPNGVVGDRGKKYADVIARVHVARAGAAPTLWPFFRDECAAHGPLAADSNSCKQAKNRQLPNVGNESAEKRKDRIPYNGQHQRANATKFVANGSPQKGKSPANQEECEKQSSVVADVA